MEFLGQLLGAGPLAWCATWFIFVTTLCMSLLASLREVIFTMASSLNPQEVFAATATSFANLSGAATTVLSKLGLVELCELLLDSLATDHQLHRAIVAAAMVVSASLVFRGMSRRKLQISLGLFGVLAASLLACWVFSVVLPLLGTVLLPPMPSPTIKLRPGKPIETGAVSLLNAHDLVRQGMDCLERQYVLDSMAKRQLPGFYQLRLVIALGTPVLALLAFGLLYVVLVFSFIASLSRRTLLNLRYNQKRLCSAIREYCNFIKIIRAQQQTISELSKLNKDLAGVNRFLIFNTNRANQAVSAIEKRLERALTSRRFWKQQTKLVGKNAAAKAQILNDVCLRMQLKLSEAHRNHEDELESPCEEIDLLQHDRAIDQALIQILQDQKFQQDNVITSMIAHVQTLQESTDRSSQLLEASLDLTSNFADEFAHSLSSASVDRSELEALCIRIRIESIERENQHQAVVKERDALRNAVVSQRAVVEGLQATVQRLERVDKQRNAELEAAENTITELRSTITRGNATLLEKNIDLQKARMVHQRLQSALDNSDAEMVEVLETLASKVHDLETQRSLPSSEETIHTLEVCIKNQHSELETKDGLIAQLDREVDYLKKAQLDVVIREQSAASSRAEELLLREFRLTITDQKAEIEHLGSQVTMLRAAAATTITVPEPTHQQIPSNAPAPMPSVPLPFALLPTGSIVMPTPPGTPELVAQRPAGPSSYQAGNGYNFGPSGSGYRGNHNGHGGRGGYSGARGGRGGSKKKANARTTEAIDLTKDHTVLGQSMGC